MATRPPTIADLFSPMKAIESCMEAQGNAVNDNLIIINDAVLNCATNLNAATNLLKRATKKIDKKLADSFKELNDTVMKGMAGTAVSSAGMSSAIVEPISTGLNTATNLIAIVSDQLSMIQKDTQNIAKKLSVAGTLKKDFMTDKIKGMFSKKDSSADKVKVPDISGGKGAGELAKSLAEAARAIDKISIRDSILLKKKAKNVIGGLLDVFKEYDKELDNKKLKRYSDAVSKLNDISGNISEINKNLAKSFVFAMIAIPGAKLSKKVIENVLEAVKPLSDAKSLEDSAVAAENLTSISKSILKFDAAMALSSILAIPAMAGIALNSLVIKESLWALRPLSTQKASVNQAIAARNLAVMGKSILEFDAAMALSSILAIPAMAGIAVTSLVIRAANFAFKSIGDPISVKLTRDAIINLNLMSLSLISFTLSLLATSMIARFMLTGTDGKTDGKDLLAIGASVVSIGLMLGTYAVFASIGSKFASENVRSASINLLLMSSSILLFSTAMFVSYLVTKTMIGNSLADGKINATDWISMLAVVPTFFLMFGAYRLFTKFGNPIDSEKAKAGGISVLLMSAGLIAFSLAFFVAHQVSKSIIGDINGVNDVWTLVMDIGILSLMLGSYYVFRKIGDPGSVKDVVAGGVSILAISVGLIVFAGALSIVHNITKSIVGNWNPKEDPAAMVMDVAIFGLMFLSMFVFRKAGGKEAFSSILKGTGAVVAMSVGIAAFGYGLKFCADALKDTSPDDIKKKLWWTPVFMAAFAVEFGIMGLGPVPAAIALGAAAAIAMSASIAVFGNALAIAAKPLKDVSADDLSELPKIIGKIGLEFIGLGLGSFLLLKGAAAMKVAANATKTLTEALRIWSDVDLGDLSVKGNKLDTLCTSIDRIKLAFQGDPEGNTKNNGFFQKLGSSLSGALRAPFDKKQIQNSADALIVAGFAIKSLANGMKVWQDSNIDETSISNLAKTVTMVKTTFGSIGAGKKSGGSLLKTLIGIDAGMFESTDVDKGIKSVMGMGRALKDISKGLTEWKEGIGSKFSDAKYMEEFGLAVANVVGGLRNVFGTIDAGDVKMTNTASKNVTQASTLIGRIFQDLTVNTFGPVSTNHVKKGIKSVKDLGSTLKDIASGLKEFKELVPNDNNSWITNVSAGISALLSGIQEPLIAFGTTDESFTKTAAQASRSAVKYSQAMASVHEISSQTVNYSKHKVDVANAMKNIGQIGSLVKGLAEGVKIMADAKLVKDLGQAGTFKSGTLEFATEGTGMIGNIQKLVCSQLSIFIELGKKIQDMGVFDDFHDEIVQDVRRGGKKTTNKKITVNGGKQSYIALAVNAAAGISGIVKGLAESYADLNKTFPTEKAMTDGISKFARAFSAVMMAFNSIGMAIVTDELLDLVPAEAGNSEMTKLFGKISGLSKLNFSDPVTNPYKIMTDNINLVINNMSDSMKKLSELSKDADVLSVNGAKFITTAANMSSIALVFSNHKTGYVVKSYGTDVIKKYSLDALDTVTIQTSLGNISKIKKAANTLSSTSKTLAGIKTGTGDVFVTFANKLTKGMNTLAGASTNIKHSTKFVETLQNAVKKKVFENISENTSKIANSINSIDNDVFEPYAKMIHALSVMTDKHSEFNKMQKELYELLEQIIDKINEAGSSTSAASSSTTAVSTTSNSNASAKTAATKPVQAQPQQVKPQTIVAKLNKDTVTVDGDEFLEKLKTILSGRG